MGPEEYGIRYDKTKSYQPFALSISLMDFNKFKRLPQSFLPSQYWGTFYKELQERWAKEEDELPLSFWGPHSFNFGIRWKSAKDIRDLYKKYLSRLPRAILDDFEDDGLIEWCETARGKDRFRVYVFDSKNKYLDKQDMSALVGRLMQAAEDYKQKNTFAAKEPFSGWYSQARSIGQQKHGGRQEKQVLKSLPFTHLTSYRERSC